jgi:dihydrolipoamide dehydrogenase
MGSEVTLLEALERVLPTEDADISRLVERGLRRQGIEVHTGTPIESVQSSDTAVTFSYGSDSVEVDYLVIAAGRAPDIEALGLDAAGVELDTDGLVRVDGAMRTSAPGVYAIGDLVAGPALAHKASDEGIIAVEDAAGLPTHPISYLDIPRATFCTPNVGSFGLTEAEAREQGYDVVVGKVPYGAVGGGTVYGDRTGLVKLVGERRYGELLGGHIVGARATELIQELVNVRALEGGYPEVARIVHGHPTLSEAVMEAARAADGWLIHG